MVDVACFLTHKKYQDDRDMVIRKGQDAGINMTIYRNKNFAILASALMETAFSYKNKSLLRNTSFGN